MTIILLGNCSKKRLGKSVEKNLKNVAFNIDIFIILESANGNAQTVLNYANEFLSDEEHNRKFSTYGKYLAFDCDDPPNIQSVVLAAAEYELLISNYLFETWLLMHFEDVKEKLSKREIYRHLSAHLYSFYLKGDKGKTREIVQNGNIEKAIVNAKLLEKQYISEGKKYICQYDRDESIYKCLQIDRTVYG